jgi:hypothetical protein
MEVLYFRYKIDGDLKLRQQTWYEKHFVDDRYRTAKEKLADYVLNFKHLLDYRQVHPGCSTVEVRDE